MTRLPTTRRRFLKGAAVATGWLPSGTSRAAEPSPPAEPSPSVEPSPPAEKTHPIRLGAPVFNAPQDPEELALAHRKLGYRAAYCPGVGLNDTDRIRAISEAFAKHDVVIDAVKPNDRAHARRRGIRQVAALPLRAGREDRRRLRLSRPLATDPKTRRPD